MTIPESLKKPKPHLTFKDGAVVVPHLGITLRQVMGCALANRDKLPAPTRHVKISYKEMIVGEVRLKTPV